MEAPLLPVTVDVEDVGGTRYQNNENRSTLTRRSGRTGYEEIADTSINLEVLDPTAEALKQCEKWVLRPYGYVLAVLGWKYKESEGTAKWLTSKLLRFIVVTAWLLGLIIASISQILVCFRRNLDAPDDATYIRNDSRLIISCQKHIITRYIVNDILIITAYLFGVFCLFSNNETEYLSNLADKTFIKCSLAHMDKQSKRLVDILRSFLAVGVVFLMLSMITRIFSALIWYTQNTAVIWGSDINGWLKNNTGHAIEGIPLYILIAISVIGLVSKDAVYVVAVLNYAAQSEMNIKLLQAIRAMAEQKLYPDLEAAMKDILESRRYLKVLNGKTAIATALILFNLGTTAVNSLNSLQNNSDDLGISFVLGTALWGSNFLLWFLSVLFPFIQAARVTAACESLKNTGPIIRSRPLQYISTPQIELDSYVIFTNSIKLRAKMFGIPIYLWMVYFGLVVLVFTMLLLIQNNTLNYVSTYL